MSKEDISLIPTLILIPTPTILRLDIGTGVIIVINGLGFDLIKIGGRAEENFTQGLWFGVGLSPTLGVLGWGIMLN